MEKSWKIMELCFWIFVGTLIEDFRKILFSFLLLDPVRSHNVYLFFGKIIIFSNMYIGK